MLDFSMSLATKPRGHLASIVGKISRGVVVVSGLCDLSAVERQAISLSRSLAGFSSVKQTFAGLDLRHALSYLGGRWQPVERRRVAVKRDQAFWGNADDRRGLLSAHPVVMYERFHVE